MSVASRFRQRHRNLKSRGRERRCRSPFRSRARWKTQENISNECAANQFCRVRGTPSGERDPTALTRCGPALRGGLAYLGVNTFHPRTVLSLVSFGIRAVAGDFAGIDGLSYDPAPYRWQMGNGDPETT